MKESLLEIFRARDLLYMIAWREIKIRYKQSVMGALWALLMPIAIISAGSLVRVAFSTISNTPVDKTDVMELAVRSIPYAFMVASIRFGTNSLVQNSNLLTKIYMPRMIFPIAAVATQLFDLLIAAAILAVFLPIMGVGVSFQLLWVPVLALGSLLLALGSAILLSAASLFFRDVKYLVEVLLTFAVFFTPVFYDSSMLGKWQSAILLNPIAPILEGFSATIVRHEPPNLPWIAYSLAMSSLLGLFSISLFNRLEPYFAERV